MARVFGFFVGVLWLVMAFVAFQRSLDGWSAGHSDIGFWWTVIGSFLAIAALGAIVGTWIHTRRSRA